MVSAKLIAAAYVAVNLWSVDAGVCHPGTRTSLSQSSVSSSTSSLPVSVSTLSADPTLSRSILSKADTSKTVVDPSPSSVSSHCFYTSSDSTSLLWSQPTLVTSLTSHTSVSAVESSGSTSASQFQSQSQTTSASVGNGFSQIDPVDQHSSTLQTPSTIQMDSSIGSSSFASSLSQSSTPETASSQSLVSTTIPFANSQSGSSTPVSQTARSGTISIATFTSSAKSLSYSNTTFARTVSESSFSTRANILPSSITTPTPTSSVAPGSSCEANLISNSGFEDATSTSFYESWDFNCPSYIRTQLSEAHKGQNYLGFTSTVDATTVSIEIGCELPLQFGGDREFILDEFTLEPVA